MGKFPRFPQTTSSRFAKNRMSLPLVSGAGARKRGEQFLRYPRKPFQGEQKPRRPQNRFTAVLHARFPDCFIRPAWTSSNQFFLLLGKPVSSSRSFPFSRPDGESDRSGPKKFWKHTKQLSRQLATNWFPSFPFGVQEVVSCCLASCFELFFQHLLQASGALAEPSGQPEFSCPPLSRLSSELRFWRKRGDVL